MKLSRFTLPIFLIILSLIVLIPQTPKAHASTPLVFMSDVINNQCATPTCNSPTISVQTTDLLMVTISASGGCPGPNQVTSTPSETWSQDQSKGGFQVWNAIAHSTSSYTITVACTSLFYAMSAYDYRGTFNGFGASVVDTPPATQSGTDSFNLNVQGGSILFETFMRDSATCATLTANNGQLSRLSGCNTNGGGNGNFGWSMYESGPTVGSGTLALSVSWSGAEQGSTIMHSGLELLSVVGSGQVGVTTVCYGVCGNPVPTFINPNATHSVNFNNSITMFYEAQSGLNGFIQNVTTNVAKSYSNGLIMFLGVYLTQPCSVNTSPFTPQCIGILQASNSFSNPQKGKVTINLQIPVTIGQWLGIAVSSNIAGLDLNETNGTCGFTGGVNCAFPPGMISGNGIIPQSISQTSVLNVAHLNSTALYSFITGAITTPLPPPSVGSGCINSDLSCFLIASACGLTPSNCFMGGGIILFIYFMVFVIGVTLSISYINREYDYQITFPPSLFFLFFLVELFMFAAVGLVPQYVAIVIFIFAGLGVAGYFGSGFMGRGKSE